MPRRRRLFRWRLLLIALLLSGALYATPGLLGRFLPDWVTTQVVPELAGRLRVGRWILSWTRAVELEDVRLLDASGAEVARVDRITTDYALAHWLTSPRRVGTVRLESPRVRAVLNAHGFNLEQALQPLFEQPAPSKVTQWRLVVIDGEATLKREETGRQIELRNIRSTFDWDAARSAEAPSATVKLSAMQPNPDGHGAGRSWAVEARGTSSTGSASLEQLRWDIRIDNLPIAILESALPVDVRWGGVLGGRFEWDGARLDCRDVKWTGSPGEVTVDGQLVPDLWRSLESWKEFSGPLTLAWEINLAEAWPRLQPWLGSSRGSFESGRLRGRAQWKTEDGRPVIEGQLHAEDLATRVGDRRDAWNVPLDAAWEIVGTRQGLELRQGRLRAPFLDLQAEGTAEQASLHLTADLDRFQRLLGNALLPPEAELGGSLSVTGSWQGMPSGAAGTLQCEAVRFRMATGPNREWLEPKWDAMIRWETRRREDRTTDLRSAHARVQAGSETLVASLRQATTWRGLQTQWPLQVHIEGDWKRWAQRLRPWLALPDDPRLPRGAFHGDATVLLGAESLEIVQGQFGGEDLEWSPTGGASWREPVWRISLENARWEYRRTCNVRRAVLQSTTVALSLIECQWPVGESWQSATGKALVRGDLGRLQRAFDAWEVGPTAVDVAGELVANLWARRATPESRQWEAKWTVRSLRVDHREEAATSPRPLWTAPELRGHIRLAESSTRAKGPLEIELLEVELPEALKVSMTGTCQLHRPERPFALEGTLAYDWESLDPYWPPSWKLHGRGKGTHPIKCEGRWPGSGSWAEAVRRDWMALTTVSWDALAIGALEMGPAKVAVGYQRGMVTTERIDTTLGTGRVSVRPWFDARTQPPHLRFDPPARLTDVRLTPEMCRGWIQYAIPLLADATSAEGELSVEAERFDWPIGNTSAADMEGKLEIRHARVGPSEPVRQMLAVFDTVAKLQGRGGVDPRRQTWLEVPQQTIAWKVRRGRVYHDPLKMKIGELELTSRGSVGLDETLDVVLSVRIPDQWLDGRPLLASLRGQTLVFPMQGTLDRPRISSDALKVIRDRLIESAGEELFRSGLERLFGSGR